MKKILIAVDGSEFSRRAFEYSLEEAKKLDNHLTILRVVPGLGYGEEVVEGIGEEIKEAKEYVDELKGEAEEEGVDADSKVITGETVANEIAKFAGEGDYDLIVIGGRGKSDLGTIHLGSVAEGVVKRAHSPVLIVR